MVIIRNLFDRSKLILYILVVIIAFLLFVITHREPQVSIKPVKETQMDDTQKLIKENMVLRERLAKLEPVAPVKIVTADQPSAAIYALPVQSVMAEGTRIPFETVYQDKDWVRPDYEPYWHSKNGQWSNLPNRVHTSYHRLFITPGNASLWNETLHECGIAELADHIKLPVDDNRPEDTIAVVAVQQEISDVVVLNNQVILVGTPARTGLQVLAIDERELVQSVSGELLTKNSNQKYLFQAVTPDGYELDYNNVMVNF